MAMALALALCLKELWLVCAMCAQVCRALMGRSCGVFLSQGSCWGKKEKKGSHECSSKASKL